MHIYVYDSGHLYCILDNNSKLTKLTDEKNQIRQYAFVNIDRDKTKEKRNPFI